MKLSKLHKQVEKLYKKNKDKCSMCKHRFDEDVITYTCTGFDQLSRLQMTSGCCQEKIKRIIKIGLMGYVENDDFEDIMKKHPLNDKFNEQARLRREHGKNSK